MKALILNNEVVQVADKDFPVHPSLIWLDCPKECVSGWTFDGNDFHEPIKEIAEPDDLKPSLNDKIDALIDFALTGSNVKVIEVLNKTLDAHL